MSFREYKLVNYAEVAAQVLSFWEKNKIFQRSTTPKTDQPTFTFYEGPPSANGTPGIHHVMGRTVKDIFCRYKTQKGFLVKRKGGWDTHGLPVELQVEKELGITKEDIGKKISVEAYNQKCREAVMRFKAQWDDLTKKMGFWVDLDNPYITFEKDYIESLWHILKKLYDKNLLYKGFTIQPYSPAAGTGLSSHELNQPGCYRTVKDTTVVAQFKIKNRENDYLLAWTTTPWTLPSNTALVVGRQIDYVKVATQNMYTGEPINVILAKNTIPNIFTADKYIPKADFSAAQEGQKIPYEIVETYKGEKLLGLAYEQLLPYKQPIYDAEKAFCVISGDFVTTEDGTGIVHCAPTFGADDFRVAKQNGVPPLTVLDENGKEMPLVDRTGRFVKGMEEFSERFVKAEYEPELVQKDKNFKPTDLLIALKLKAENKAFKVEKYEHNYPHCWRTDKPILYYPLSSWFIRTTELKERMVDLNKTINWKPASTGEGRFGNWLENLVDWNLSRSRFWGTPLPIWRDADDKEKICVGSVAELKALMEKANASNALSEQEKTDNQKVLDNLSSKEADLHRPFVDYITLVSETNQPLKREPDLIDVWFDSGAMPYAQWHYPFENQDIFAQNFPADFIAEGVDQTRGWFFTLHALAVMLQDSVAFKNVISNGLVLDKQGNKMSKRLGNVINPFEALAKYGADPVRWYMVENAPPWDNLKFDLEGVVEVQRKFFSTLQNTYSFFALYANLDKFDLKNEPLLPLSQRDESDRWVLSRLNSLIKIVNAAYENYDPTKATRAMNEFLNNDLSNWYVRQNRKRFWKGEYNQDKKAAYQTLGQCLETLVCLAAPVAPFYTEMLYRDLHKAEANTVISVHLAPFPMPDEAAIDLKLEKRMALAQQISSLAHSLRKRQKIRVRQPLNKILIPAIDEALREDIRYVQNIICAETNVKKIDFIADDTGILKKKIKPNFKKLGQSHGKILKDISAAIALFTQEDIRSLENSNHALIHINGTEVVLNTELVDISSDDIEGWLVAQEEGLVVALDIHISPELEAEGLARDFVNRVQNLRKDLGYEVQDKIQIFVADTSPNVKKAIDTHKAYICAEVQALLLDFKPSLGAPTLLELEGYEVGIEIAKM
ncbi:MAG: isoleucine--tRNA ligase [Cytophagales bacterium]|nr:MAG: isoleucine--tRNA ligase [Cytophagales bacterium]TAF60645.1 MAG: isoleucine--tRNA ligase [Cytophagales bacterium]